MKRIATLVCLLLLSVAAFAQHPDVRDASTIELMGLHPKESFQKSNAQALSLGYSLLGCRQEKHGIQVCEYVKDSREGPGPGARSASEAWNSNDSDRLSLRFYSSYGLQNIKYEFADESTEHNLLTLLTTKYGRPVDEAMAGWWAKIWSVKVGASTCAVVLGGPYFELKELVMICSDPKIDREVLAAIKAEQKAAAKADKADPYDHPGKD